MIVTTNPALPITNTIGSILESQDPTIMEQLHPMHVHIFIPSHRTNDGPNSPVIAFDTWGNGITLFPEERGQKPIIWAFESTEIIEQLKERYHSLVVTAPHVDGD